MKTMFYIVRHGQTLFNVKELIQGWSDSPLTPLGVHQAQLMAEKISPIEFILGVSSTSERARDTLLTITQERFPVLFYKDLKEVGFGSLEGGDRRPLLESSRRDYTPWGGENFVNYGEHLIYVVGEVKPGDYLTTSYVRGAAIVTNFEELAFAVVTEGRLPSPDVEFPVVGGCHATFLKK